MKYAFINAAVLDGSENMQPTKNTAVLVEDGIIKAIEPSADSFGDVEMIDLEGRYLMAGAYKPACASARFGYAELHKKAER